MKPILLIGPSGSGKTHITDAFLTAYDSYEFYPLEEITHITDMERLDLFSDQDAVIISDLRSYDQIVKLVKFAPFVPQTQIIMHSTSHTHIPALIELDLTVIKTQFKYL